MLEGVSFSPLLSTGGGGVLVALPYEAIGEWKPGEAYEELLDRCVEPFAQLEPFGSATGVVVNDMDGNGLMEAHWMRLHEAPEPILVAWSEWADPARQYYPENLTKIARAWREGNDPRQPWLKQQVQAGKHVWQRLEGTQTISSGVLVLAHPEWPTSGARFAHPQRVARCGQLIPWGLTPGEYEVEILVINELTTGDHFCLLCRWLPCR